MKTWTYYNSATWHDNVTNTSHSFITQLYLTGVYFIADGDPSKQAGFAPKDMETICKHLKETEEKGTIKDLVFGREVKVTTDKDGLFKEINN